MKSRLSSITPISRTFCPRLAASAASRRLSRFPGPIGIGATSTIDARRTSASAAVYAASDTLENGASSAMSRSSAWAGVVVTNQRAPSCQTSSRRAPNSWAPAAAPRGAVLVIHENKGLNDWVRSVAGRLAGVGYSALAVDLLSEEGGTASFGDPAAATAALGAAAPDRFLGDLRSGLDELQRRAPGQKLAVVGFCFGGGLVWRLLAAGEPRLSAAAPFYGPLPDDPDFSGSKDVAVLGFYGALDQRVTSTEPTAKAALERAGLVHELIVEPDADHAFFNDTGARYNATAAASVVNPAPASFVGDLTGAAQVDFTKVQQFAVNLKQPPAEKK